MYRSDTTQTKVLSLPLSSIKTNQILPPGDMDTDYTHDILPTSGGFVSKQPERKHYCVLHDHLSKYWRARWT